MPEHGSVAARKAALRTGFRAVQGIARGAARASALPMVIGLITPPYGLSLLDSSKYVGVGFGRAVVRSLPLYAVFFLTIAFVVLFPEVVLWLPKWLIPESVGCFKAPGGGGYICPT